MTTKSRACRFGGCKNVVTFSLKGYPRYCEEHRPKRWQRGRTIEKICEHCGITMVLSPLCWARRFCPTCRDSPERVTRDERERNAVRMRHLRAQNKTAIAELRRLKKASPFLCESCAGMPHRRPPAGCPECGRPHGPDVDETPPPSLLVSSAGRCC